MKPHLALALCLTFIVTGCARYSTVSEIRPQYKPIRSAIGALVSAEVDFEDAARMEKRKPLEAVGELLDVAQVASQQLAKDPNDTGARDTYNFAVSRIFGIIKKAKLDPWTAPLTIPAEGGDYVLTRKPDARKAWNPALYDFTPADQFDVHGKYVDERIIREGVGAPVVAVGREDNPDAKADFALPRVYYGVTAVIRFEGRRAVIGFDDPLAAERVTIGGRSYPLAADFTVPVAVLLASSDPKKMEMSRLLNPEKYAETARVARLQPYDPEKRVVLVIHGLMDSPATWTPMLNTLRGNEEIRRNYQFWFYSYPSGYPYPYSAAILRRELDAIEKRYPLKKPMVVIGHSMGGCISRLLITDTKDDLWIKIFGKPPAEVDLNAESKQALSESLIFKHRDEIGRVIFIAAPLRGATMAKTLPGRIGSMLVHSPSTLLTIGRDAMKLVTFQGDDLKLKRIPNSVDTLAPNNRFVRAIQTIPITPGIPYHVISGDRGKGGNPDETKPIRTDGVVPYWSSHMEGAQSELVVPSNHSAHQNPQAIAEVARILKLNAKK